MKKLNVNNAGRMPLWQDDLAWMQASYTDAIEAIVSELGLGKGYFIIKGCSPYHPSGNQKFIAMDAGWFYFGGRVLPVRALAATDITSYRIPMVRLSKVTNFDANGARNFIRPDLSTQAVANVWQDDYLQPSIVECYDVSFTGGVRLGVGAWTLSDILAHNKVDAESDWIQSRSGDLEFKCIGRMVVLRGIATDVTGTVTAVDEGLPIPLGGQANLHIPNAPGDFWIYVNGSGELICYSTGGQGEPTLTGMMYMAATPYNATDPNTINDNNAIQS